jgi:hypothetical protein
MTTTSSGTYCSSCGRDRSGDAGATDDPHTPCPDCGTTALTYQVQINESISATDSLSFELDPGQQDRDWQMRWDIIQRTLNEVTAPRTEECSSGAVHYAQQRLFDFLVQAYHLKDALKAEAAVPPQDVESAISNSPSLALLADLANQDKHGKLNHSPRSGSVPTNFKATARSGTGAWRLVVTFEHNGATVNAIDLAERIVVEWRDLLRGWGLI